MKRIMGAADARRVLDDLLTARKPAAKSKPAPKRQSQFEWHENPRPGHLCDVCGCPGTVRARYHRALKAEELWSGAYPAGTVYLKSVKVAFGADSEVRPVAPDGAREARKGR